MNSNDPRPDSCLKQGPTKSKPKKRSNATMSKPAVTATRSSPNTPGSSSTIKLRGNSRDPRTANQSDCGIIEGTKKVKLLPPSKVAPPSYMAADCLKVNYLSRSILKPQAYKPVAPSRPSTPSGIKLGMSRTGNNIVMPNESTIDGNAGMLTNQDVRANDYIPIAHVVNKAPVDTRFCVPSRTPEMQQERVAPVRDPSMALPSGVYPGKTSTADMLQPSQVQNASNDTVEMRPFHGRDPSYFRVAHRRRLRRYPDYSTNSYVGMHQNFVTDSHAGMHPNYVTNSQAELRPNNVTDSRAELHPSYVTSSSVGLDGNYMTGSRAELNTDHMTGASAGMHPDYVTSSHAELHQSHINSSRTRLRPEFVTTSRDGQPSTWNYTSTDLRASQNISGPNPNEVGNVLFDTSRARAYAADTIQPRLISHPTLERGPFAQAQPTSLYYTNTVSMSHRNLNEVQVITNTNSSMAEGIEDKAVHLPFGSANNARNAMIPHQTTRSFGMNANFVSAPNTNFSNGSTVRGIFPVTNLVGNQGGTSSHGKVWPVYAGHHPETGPLVEGFNQHMTTVLVEKYCVYVAELRLDGTPVQDPRAATAPNIPGQNAKTHTKGSAVQSKVTSPSDRAPQIKKTQRTKYSKKGKKTPPKSNNTVPGSKPRSILSMSVISKLSKMYVYEKYELENKDDLDVKKFLETDSRDDSENVRRYILKHGYKILMLKIEVGVLPHEIYGAVYNIFDSPDNLSITFVNSAKRSLQSCKGLKSGVYELRFSWPQASK